MTHQEYRERLDEIYPFCNSTKPDPENPRKCYYCGEFLSDFSHAGKQAIDRLFLDAIGYEQYPDEAKSVTYDLMVRSKFRAELRNTITGGTYDTTKQ